MTTYSAIIGALPSGWARAREGTPLAGTDGVSLSRFELNLAAEMAALRRELAVRTYRPRPMLGFYLPKPDGGRRLLAIPAVRDRVAQAAALAVLGPVVEAELEASSFAYRAGRSYKDAVGRLRALYGEGFRWVVEADVTAFFDRVDHTLLLGHLAALGADAETAALVRAWLTAPTLLDGALLPRTEGLPQGAVISPLLANLYLDPLDEALTADGFRLVRYADDFVVVCKSRPRAEAALRLTARVLAELELELNPSKTRITTFDAGFRFLGHLFLGGLVLPGAKGPLEVLPEPVEGGRKTVDSGQWTENGGRWTVDCGRKTVDSGQKTGGGGEGEKDTDKPVAPHLPSRAEMEETALGRAFLAALDAEGLTPADFLRVLAAVPAPAPPAGPAAVSLGGPLEGEGEVGEPFGVPLVARPGEVLRHRTLYVQAQGAWLRLDHDRFVVTQSRDPSRPLLDVPALKVDHVVVFGSVLITPAVLRHCFGRGVPITFLSSRGAYYGQAESTLGRDAGRLRLQVVRGLDDAFRLDAARRFVAGRLHNARGVLRRHARRRADGSAARLHAAADALARTLRRLPGAATLDVLRGLEGEASAAYFAAFPALLEGTPFTFEGRTRRPPTDPVNALLSFGYTLLFHRLYAACLRHRLHPYLGFLHADRHGHPALVSDLLEEFRFLAERLALTLCHKRILSPDDFTRPDADRPGCFLSDDARRRFLHAFEQALAQRVTHPTSGRTTDYRTCLDLQVRAFARHLEDAAPYVPFRLPD